jgi:hypothetical protein
VDPLQDSRYTFARAKHHIEDFDARVEAFAESEPYGFTPNVYPEGSVKFGLVNPMPPELHAIFADAAHNLRRSLDQACYSVAGAEHDADFPFARKWRDVKRMDRGKSKNLPPEIFQVVIALKPCMSGNRTLWAVHELDRIGKHRRLVRMSPFFQEWRFDMLGKKTSIVMDMREDQPKWHERGTKEYHHFEHAPFVVTEEIDGVPSTPASILLDGMASQVECALDAIETAARDLGIG